jgi:hypothetical protein
MHVFYQADTVKVMGIERERTHHLRSDNADSASVTVASTGNNVFGSSAADTFEWSGPRCVMGDADRTHVLGLESGTANELGIFHNDVTTGGTPTDTNDDDTTFLAESTEPYMLGTPCSFNRAGTVKCRFPYKENTTDDFEIIAFDSGAAPSFTSQNVTSVNALQSTGSAPNMVAAPLGSTVYGVWINGGDLDFDKDGPKIALTYSFAGTIIYSEITLTVSTASLNDVDMGEFHSFHGPFEI